jgi:hypothetical protein
MAPSVAVGRGRLNGQTRAWFAFSLLHDTGTNKVSVFTACWLFDARSVADFVLVVSLWTCFAFSSSCSLEQLSSLPCVCFLAFRHKVEVALAFVWNRVERALVVHFAVKIAQLFGDFSFWEAASGPTAVGFQVAVV